MAFTDEQVELRALVREFLTDRAPESAVRTTMATDRGLDDALWRQMAEQLGLQGLAIPERFGGAGYGLVELGIMFEEMGRALLCAPFLSTIGLAAMALLASGDEQACAEHLPGIAAGTTVATMAIEGPDLSAEPDGSGWRLTGHKTYVLDGHVADLVLVAATTAAGQELFAVSAESCRAEGLSVELTPTLDQTRKLARIDFDGAIARQVGGGGAATLRATLDRARVLLAAEQVGGTAATLDMAVGYAGVREQFGRPIGSFQAIKHKCADMLVDLECARTAAYHALAVTDLDEVELSAAVAGSICSEAYVRCAEHNIQIHGGIGFTWEHPAHLYYKRAKSSEVLFGTPTRHRRVIAEQSGILNREAVS